MTAWNKVQDDLAEGKRGPVQEEDETYHHRMRHHIDHCFRYLRQSIVCCGDTALEGQNTKVTRPDTDGTGATHLCKDIEQVKVWAEQRRLGDMHSIERLEDDVSFFNMIEGICSRSETLVSGVNRDC
jgi:hypothetical protein